MHDVDNDVCPVAINRWDYGLFEALDELINKGGCHDEGRNN